MKPKNSSNLALLKGVIILAALYLLCLLLLPISLLGIAAAKIREICKIKVDGENVLRYNIYHKPATPDNQIHSSN